MRTVQWETVAKEAMEQAPAIVVPSHGRAGKVMTRKLFPEAILFIHESEAEEYQAKEGGEIVTYPDDVVGNIAKIRNLIRRKWFDRNLVTIDDDLVSMGFFEHGKTHEMERERVMTMIETGFHQAHELGVFIWGVNLAQDPMFYREHTPISFLSPVLGPFTAHRPSSLRYDERFPLKEDYDFCLQHFQRYRKVMRFNKYYYHCLHLLNDGGVTKFRTIEKEKQQLRLFQRKWGNRVVRFDLDKSVNPIINPPLKGV